VVNHTNYDAYTFVELTEAIFGNLPPKEGATVVQKGANGAPAVTSYIDYSKAYPGGMLDIADRIQDVQNTLLDGFYDIAEQLVYLKKHWQGPASGAFQEVNEIYRQHVRATFQSVNWPSYRMAIMAAGNYLLWAQYEMWNAYQAGFVKVPPSTKTVHHPAEVVPGGYGGEPGFTIPAYDETVPVPGYIKWDSERAAQYGRNVLKQVRDLYFERETYFGELPVPPKLGELPSAAADKAEEKKAIDDEKKAIEEEKQQAKEDKEKLDEDIAKEKADAKKAADEAAKQNEELFEKFNQPPPPPPGGDLGGAPPELPKGADPFVDAGAPGALGGVPVPGGTDLDGDGKADLDEEGKPLPGFGEPVPGGIDLSGDGKPDLDENGNPLPGADFSKLPLAGSPAPSVSFAPTTGRLGTPPPLGPPPALARGPIPIPTDDPPGVSRPGGAPGGKPFVRPPILNLDGPDSLTPAKAGTSIPFVRSPGSAGADVDEFGNPKLLKSGGGFGAPAEGGSAGGRGAPPRAGAPGIPGVPGFPGAGLGSGMGAGGYPPPMGGMGGGAPGMGGQQQNGERERQTWLLEDDEIWSEDDDAIYVIGRPAEDDEDEEYAPQS
jgi:uncharacterized protein YukE